MQRLLVLEGELDVLLGKPPEGAGLEPPQREPADGGALQAGNLVTEVEEHTSYLALAALCQDQLAASLGRGRPYSPCRPVLQHYALFQPLQVLFHDRTLGGPDAVRLLMTVAGVREPHGEVAVGGEQQQPFRFEVEPAYGVQAVHGRQELDHRGSPPLVLNGAEYAGRLVQHVGDRPKWPCYLLPVNGDPVAGRDPVAQSGNVAVDLDAAGTDQLLGGTPAGDARLRHELLNSFPLAHERQSTGEGPRGVPALSAQLVRLRS